MARRHRHLIGYRILLVLVIPTMYFLCVSVAGLFSSDVGGGRNLQSIRLRKILGIETNTETTINCTSPAVNEFPPDGLTRQQRQSGFVAIHVIIVTYLFLVLAIVCDDYFIPSIKMICEKLNVAKDVAGATLMAAATSSPELFINVVGTFVTEGDLGVGTIVGSAVFNILAVPACCGLFASQVLELEWWPVSRDSLCYGITVGLLIVTLKDGRVEWYEALVLVVAYVLYILAMAFNERISNFMNWALARRRKYKNLSEESPLVPKNLNKEKNVHSFELSDDDSVEIVNMTQWPNSKLERIWWLLTWPINLVLLVTVPDCRRKSLRSWYPLTFIMCIVWIALISYVVAWIITIIGDTLTIPDSVMGLTFLAAGMSVPEAVSSVIVTNHGHGTMGISNSIGSNIFDVLLCLGLPWFIKSAFLPKTPGLYSVKINSEGLVYSSVSLLSTLLLLYLMLFINKFKLDRKVGFQCLTMYGIFLILASLIELNIFFVVNMPTCVH
ncbi:sodium/potassium/calcium exchanger 4 [Orussus abietinus]|uniref:sodium/potassium/calcium exchanger 4 n=1 Tax=Orussus abietinus TaxID=222816 RepID=UPI00062507C3|nr:sodium/potassium/calcium exchanger 4 [Orussus abietinus]